MAKTQKARIEELEIAIDQIHNQSRGLKAQINRKDRNPVDIGCKAADKIMAICMEVNKRNE